MPGDVLWNEAGFRFSWRVMLVEKGGDVVFHVRAADGTARAVRPSEFLTPLQGRAMSTQPDMIHEAAGWLSELYAVRGERAQVYADVWVSLNGRAPARLVDESVNLAAEPRPWGTPPWVLPSPRDGRTTR